MEILPFLPICDSHFKFYDLLKLFKNLTNTYLGFVICLVLRLIHLNFTPPVRVQVLLLSVFYIGGNQSTERINELSQVVEQEFKPSLAAESMLLKITASQYHLKILYLNHKLTNQADPKIHL